MESKKKLVCGTGMAVLALAAFGGCSTTGGSQEKSGSEVSTTGPSIMEVRTNPNNFTLNDRMQPVSPAQVFADVQDFSAPVSEVKLRFERIPLEIPMKKLAGNTWQASLSTQQLRQLAVSGKTMTYDAVVIAKDKSGKVATSEKPIQVAVTAPEATRIAS